MAGSNEQIFDGAVSQRFCVSGMKVDGMHK